VGERETLEAVAAASEAAFSLSSQIGLRLRRRVGPFKWRTKE